MHSGSQQAALARVNSTQALYAVMNPVKKKLDRTFDEVRLFRKTQLSHQVKTSYPYFVRTSRSTQMGCIAAQILSLYANSDYIGSATFVFMTTICLYNLFVVTKRWYNSIDGRFDLRRMFTESNTQVKIQYALEVFTPLAIGLLVFSCVNLRGGLANFMWMLASCVLIAAAALLVLMEFYEVFIVVYWEKSRMK